MKYIAFLFLALAVAEAKPKLPIFLVQCPSPECPIEGKQKLQAQKIQVIGSTSTGAGALVDRTITFKCAKCGKFTAQDKILVPAPEPPVEVKKQVKPAKAEPVTVRRASSKGKGRVIQMPPMPPTPTNRVLKASEPKPKLEVGPITKPIEGEIRRRDERIPLAPAFVPASIPSTAPLIWVYYTKDIRTVVPGTDLVAIEDRNFVQAIQPAGSGVQIQMGEDLVNWSTLADWPPDAEAQLVMLTWYNPSWSRPKANFFRRVLY